MKSLRENLIRSLKKDRFINESIKPADEKLFWRWIDAMGGPENISDPDSVFDKAIKLHTTPEQWELFSDIYYYYKSEIENTYYDYSDELDLSYGDDGIEYMSAGAVWQGEKVVKRFLEKHDNPDEIFNFDWADGEEMLGIFEDTEAYEDYYGDETEIDPKVRKMKFK